MLKILHFSDAHIDITRFGRHDPQSGLPIRVLDFLKSLDTIIDTALTEKVDLVIFSGDAYRDRTPVPTFQREWGKRMMRLSQAKIPTLLVVGNHDLSPAAGRAHALQEYETLSVPYIRVISQVEFLTPDMLWDLPLQVIGLPWITPSKLMANLKPEEENSTISSDTSEIILARLIQNFISKVDPDLPAILAGHVSVQGAIYGNERSVMLGKDVVLPLAVLRDAKLDYVALGHIHKAQDLNEDRQPPIVYPGSIERVDFGEVNDEKRFVIAQVEKGSCRYEWRNLPGRKFFDQKIELRHQENIQNELKAILPKPEEMKDAIGRLTIVYPREWEIYIDESALRQYGKNAFEFHIIRHTQIRIGDKLSGVESFLGKTNAEQLEFYWQNLGLSESESKQLSPLAADIMASVHRGINPEIELEENNT